MIADGYRAGVSASAPTVEEMHSMPTIGLRFAPDVPMDIQDDVELILVDICRTVAGIRFPLLASPWRQRVEKWFGNAHPTVVQMIEGNVRISARHTPATRRRDGCFRYCMN